MPVSEKRLRLLTFPFEQKDLQARPGATTKAKDKAIILWYLDARAVSERLDMICGPANWKARYFVGPSKDSVTCALSINVEYEDGSTEWVEKEDGAGSDSDIEQQKAAYSNAFRRAAAAGWGVGRILYEVPNEWGALKEGTSYFADKNLKIPPQFLPKKFGTEAWDEYIVPLIDEYNTLDEAAVKERFKEKFGSHAPALLEAILFAEKVLNE